MRSLRAANTRLHRLFHGLNQNHVSFSCRCVSARTIPPEIEIFIWTDPRVGKTASCYEFSKGDFHDLRQADEKSPTSPLCPHERTSSARPVMSEKCRFCCKTLFASPTANFPARTCGDLIL